MRAATRPGSADPPNAPAVTGARAAGLLDRGASALEVVGGDDEPDAAERRVRELDVHVRLAELARELTERPGAVADVDDEDLALVGEPEPRLLDRRPRARGVGVVEEKVDHAAALAGERREPLDVRAGQPGRLAEPRQLA